LEIGETLTLPIPKLPVGPEKFRNGFNMLAPQMHCKAPKTLCMLNLQSLITKTEGGGNKRPNPFTERKIVIKHDDEYIEYMEKMDG